MDRTHFMTKYIGSYNSRDLLSSFVVPTYNCTPVNLLQFYTESIKAVMSSVKRSVECQNFVVRCTLVQKSPNIQIQIRTSRLSTEINSA